MAPAFKAHNRSGTANHLFRGTCLPIPFLTPRSAKFDIFALRAGQALAQPKLMLEGPLRAKHCSAEGKTQAVKAPA